MIGYSLVHLPQKQIFKRPVLLPSQFWLVETSSLSEFRASMTDVNIPFDSNLLVFSRDKSENLDIFDVYRPTPTSEIK